jgi:hypothetical protein
MQLRGSEGGGRVEGGLWWPKQRRRNRGASDMGWNSRSIHAVVKGCIVPVVCSRLRSAMSTPCVLTSRCVRVGDGGDGVEAMDVVVVVVVVVVDVVVEAVVVGDSASSETDG